MTLRSNTAENNRNQEIVGNNPILLPHPSKLFVEPTTFCNMQCSMCVKQAKESRISEGTMALETFSALIPAFPHLESLILTGIGEPLLHPQLEQFITIAKQHMPASGWVGFQTNGHMVDENRALSLIKSGVDRICISIDAATPILYQQIRNGGAIQDAKGAVRLLNKSRQSATDGNLKIGVEFVLMDSNLEELSNVIRWAAKERVDFVIVTHALAYDPTTEGEVLYCPNTDASNALYQKWNRIAESEGVRLTDYFKSRWKFKRTESEQKVVDLMEKMVHDGFEAGIPIHLRNLMNQDKKNRFHLETILGEARKIAEQYGIDLTLPAVSPQWHRQCKFIEKGSAFISWEGDVHPCYFLWHRYTCFQDGQPNHVIPKIFGRVLDNDILGIWNSPDFLSFRTNVTQYDFPYCSNCNVGPCDLIYAETFETDCYAIDVPCGYCPWCMGLLECLQ